MASWWSATLTWTKAPRNPVNGCAAICCSTCWAALSTSAKAKANAERQRQEASLFRSQRLSQAEALAKELTSRARVATDTIVALAQERDPQKQVLLRQRLWRERLESVMRKAGQVVAVTRSQPMKLWLSGGAP